MVRTGGAVQDEPTVFFFHSFPSILLLVRVSSHQAVLLYYSEKRNIEKKNENLQT